MSWLKFDCTTPEKPEVFAITIALGFNDPDLTVGKLLKVWRWFDSHSVNGIAKGLTVELLDRLIGCNGLAQAMIDVGWLALIDGNLTLVNFENHNGKTAKARALGAARSASFRGSNDESVTDALPRGEERREEKKNTNTAKQTASRLPSDMDFDFDFARQHGVANIPEQVERFKDYYNSLADSRGFRKDWQGVWRNWCRKAVEVKTLRLVEPSITTPSKQGRDPELERLEREAGKASKPSAEVLAQIAKLRKTA